MPAWTLLLPAALILAAILLLWLRRRRNRGMQTRRIGIDAIADVHRQISEQAVETSFAVFVISPPGSDSVEIQFSVENGITGLDWILMSEPNRREKARVLRYGQDHGVHWQDSEMNGWIYLRTEQGDLAAFCTGLIRDLYAVEDVLLKYGGFRYRP